MIKTAALISRELGISLSTFRELVLKKVIKVEREMDGLRTYFLTDEGIVKAKAAIVKSRNRPKKSERDELNLLKDFLLFYEGTEGAEKVDEKRLREFLSERKESKR